MAVLNEAQMRKALRDTMSSARSSLSRQQVEEHSGRIIAGLYNLPEIRQAGNIMCFSSIRNEVELGSFISQARQEGKHILLPRVEEKGAMSAVAYEPGNTRQGPFGIIEPAGEAFDPQKIDAVLVPALVFDFAGYRLGYGGGYYDRFLPRLRPGAFVCGVGYDFQIVETVFPHPGDVPVHWIVTEKSEIAVNWAHF